MADSNVTLIGNLTRDPELRHTPSGQAVVDLGVAVNNRVKEGDDWVDGPGQFFDVSAWGTLAENVASSLTKGTRVVVSGVLRYESWENDEGETRSKVKVTADAVGPDLRWAEASVTRIPSGGGGGQANATSRPANRPKPNDSLEDPF